MRVAFAGAHRTGKSTLLEAVAEQLPGYATVDEPYWVLEDEGHELADPPTAGDFELQLRRSVELLADAGADALFDRCPLDFVAYLRAIDDGDDTAAPDVDELRDAMATLDLVVLVPIEAPDRIAVPVAEDRRLRRDVDELLRGLLLDDALGLGLDVEVLEVGGDVDARVGQVLRAIRGR